MFCLQKACWSAPMPYDPPPNLASLSLTEIAERVAARKLPPVSEWHPQKSGDSEMQIAADGRWYHQGGEIRRPAMVRAFSTLLRRDADGAYWLVTPQEKLSIVVEDAPFIAVEMQSEGQGKARKLAFRLNSDDLVIAGPNSVIELRPLPYLYVRDGLWAKLSRPVYYEMAELAIEEANQPLGLWSEGQFFPIGEEQ
jgi:uncharacterized protein